MNRIELALTASLILFIAYGLSGCAPARLFVHCVERAARCN